MKLPYLDWPPPYTIKVSARSRRMSIKISAHKGLEIIIPKRTNHQKAIDFLNLKQDWIQKHRHLLQAKINTPLLPVTINLKAIEEVWTVKYKQNITKKIFVSEATSTLLIKGDDYKTSLSLIKKWLTQKAQKHLSDLTERFSRLYSMPYQSVRVRYQRSRWGSCTKDKAINLNCKLMFLPLELTHYIIVHELVHTIHFDHSPSFWAAVEKWIPNQKLLRTRLKNIEQELPNWLYYLAPTS